MTPKEKADLQNRQDWEAERQALMDRALAYAAYKRAQESARAANVTLSDCSLKRRVPMTSAPLRKVRLLPVNGAMKSIPQLAAETGISESAIRNRLSAGWELERAISEPPSLGRPKQLYDIGGRPLSIREWSELTGIAEFTLRSRVNAGVSMREAIGLGSAPRRKRGRPARRPGAPSQLSTTA